MWFWLVSGDQAAPGLKGFVIDPPAVAAGLGSRGTVTLTRPGSSRRCAGDSIERQ